MKRIITLISILTLTTSQACFEPPTVLTMGEDFEGKSFEISSHSLSFGDQKIIGNGSQLCIEANSHEICIDSHDERWYFKNSSPKNFVKDKILITDEKSGKKYALVDGAKCNQYKSQCSGSCNLQIQEVDFLGNPQDGAINLEFAQRRAGQGSNCGQVAKVVYLKDNKRMASYEETYDPNAPIYKNGKPRGLGSGRSLDLSQQIGTHQKEAGCGGKYVFIPEGASPNGETASSTSGRSAAAIK